MHSQRATRVAASGGEERTEDGDLENDATSKHQNKLIIGALTPTARS
jgi:hypothetical protein